MRILFLGDSIMGNIFQKTFVDKLRERVNSTELVIVNGGLSGITASAAMYIIDSFLKPIKPDVVVVGYGLGESVFSLKPHLRSKMISIETLTPESYHFFMNQIVNKLKNNGIEKIYLFAYPPSNDKEITNLYRTQYFPLLHKLNLPILDADNVFDGQDLNKIYCNEFPDAYGEKGQDYLHPGDKGQSLLVDFIYKKLAEGKLIKA